MLGSIDIFKFVDIINLSVDLNRREGVYGIEMTIDLRWSRVVQNSDYIEYHRKTKVQTRCIFGSINIFLSADLINLSDYLNRREGVYGIEMIIDFQWSRVVQNSDYIECHRRTRVQTRSVLDSINVFRSADLINLSIDLNRREGVYGIKIVINF
jgi:hypothetical protein